ncbi:MAG TPA: hypothetical protein VG815_00465, partial [Chloroflexota bacterium]|nr:hypothetical protein [Chloroflexota bacterium]
YSQAKKPPKQCLSEEQHMVVAMYGEGPARGGLMNLRSWFLGNQKLQITAGKIYGSAIIPKKARKILKEGFGHQSINRWFGKYKNQILQDFHIPKPIMRGTAGSGSAQPGYCYGHSKLCTNRSTSGNGTGTTGGSTPPTSSSRPVWMAPLGGSLIGIAFILLAVYFWQERKRGPRTSGKRSAVDHP